MKVLIVDDSIVFRSGVSKALEGVPGIEVVKAVSNGKIALDFLEHNSNIDLVILDLEMPVMDGIETLTKLRETNKKVKVIIFSSLSIQGAEKTIQALSKGADDFATKSLVEPGGSLESAIESIRDNLIPKILSLVPVKNIEQKLKGSVEKFTKQIISQAYIEGRENYSSENYTKEMPVVPKLIVIASSTGGPDALSHIFSNLKVVPKVPILIVQHMPPIFTSKLAESLDESSKADICEAKAGDVLCAGRVYIAPGDFHLKYGNLGKLELNQGAKNCFVRPSANVLFNSVYANFTGKVLSIVLTGMGEDGMQGASLLAQKKSYIYIQDKKTSVVWGMPGSIFKKDISCYSLALDKFSDLIDSVSKRI